jgi:hypothetical protein
MRKPHYKKTYAVIPHRIFDILEHLMLSILLRTERSILHHRRRIRARSECSIMVGISRVLSARLRSTGRDGVVQKQ